KTWGIEPVNRFDIISCSPKINDVTKITIVTPVATALIVIKVCMPPENRWRNASRNSKRYRFGINAEATSSENEAIVQSSFRTTAGVSLVGPHSVPLYNICRVRDDEIFRI